MVKKADVDKDIDTIAEKNGVLFFSYVDVFNKKIKNKYHYDYETVINKYAKAKNISHDEAKEALIKRQILSPIPNGEFRINVSNSTLGGGGSTIGGDIVMTFNNDIQTKYHEIAHTLQHKYNLFNEETIQQQYQKSSANLTEKEKQNKLINKDLYSLYLKEMHAESFSFAAMMLRAENGFDFLRQMSYAYHNGLYRNFSATMTEGFPDYKFNKPKFYASLPVMKQTIKTIRNIRKNGQTADFFDENGILRDEKLAKLCENIVLESAYSPRTLNSFFKTDILDEHNKNEHGWRKDSAQSLIQGIPATIITGIKGKNTLTFLNVTQKIILDAIVDKNIKNDLNNNNTFKKTKLSQVIEQAKIVKSIIAPPRMRKIDDNSR